MKYEFDTFYWGKNTKVKFEPFEEIPKDIPVTSCMVMAVINKKYLVISSPQRGWGLPGGHLEDGETPIETVTRELEEEAAVEVDLNSLKVVGGYLATKINKTPKNEKYPDLAYQLLFIGEVNKINQFPKGYEVFDRYFVPIAEALNYIDGTNFKPIFNYVTERYKQAFSKHEHEDKVSIIVPFYNDEEYIDKCLDSISKQSYKNIEILLVNDGSTDNSNKLCEKYLNSDTRFSITEHNTNRGLNAARNTGLDFISGNYVSFVNAYDYIDENFISELLSVGIKNKANIVECLDSSNTEDKLVDKNVDDQNKNNLTASTDEEMLNSSSACVKLYDANLFKNNHITFNESLNNAEDIDTLDKIYSEAKKHASVKDVLYFHTVRK